MGDLTKDFSKSEFACHCGCGFDSIDKRLVSLLQDVRDHLGLSIKILSGCRCEKHNKAVGGEPHSFHVKGMAADIKIMGLPPVRVHELLEKKYSSRFGGLGLYPNFVHVDVRDYIARWNKTK